MLTGGIEPNMATMEAEILLSGKWNQDRCLFSYSRQEPSRDQMSAGICGSNGNRKFEKKNCSSGCFVMGL